MEVWHLKITCVLCSSGKSPERACAYTCKCSRRVNCSHETLPCTRTWEGAAVGTWGGSGLVCLLFPEKHLSTAEIATPEPEWWRNWVQESCHCFSARVGDHMSLYILRCTNSLAHSFMHIYLRMNWQNPLKHTEETYNKMRNGTLFS